MKKYYILIAAILCLFIGTIKAQYTILHNFNDTLGLAPFGSLVRGGNTLYGMTQSGGTDSDGIIFSMDTNGNRYKVLLNFNDTNGEGPYGSLILSGKVLYGMTYEGGIANGGGRIFSIDTDGTAYTDLHDINSIHGGNPFGSLVLAGNVLYGMISLGGTYDSGLVFSIHTNGSAYKILLSFDGLNGAFPEGTLIVLGHKLYGMATFGGANGYGNVFSMDTTGGAYKDLWDFNDTGTNGATPYYTSLTPSGNVLYGMTNEGGINSVGNIFSIDTNGGGYRDLFDFAGTNGQYPFGSLTLFGKKLYGLTFSGANDGYGNIFSIDTNGSVYEDIWDFDDTGVNGANPYGALIISGNLLYGMTESGGIDDDGVVFALDTNAMAIATSINEITETKGTTNIYPNPNNGQFTIQSSVISKQLSVEIYNMLGEKIVVEMIPANQNNIAVNMANQPDGLYLYRVITQAGNLIGQGKIVVQK